MGAGVRALWQPKQHCSAHVTKTLTTTVVEQKSADGKLVVSLCNSLRPALTRCCRMCWRRHAALSLGKLAHRCTSEAVCVCVCKHMYLHLNMPFLAHFVCPGAAPHSDKHTYHTGPQGMYRAAEAEAVSSQALGTCICILVLSHFVCRTTLDHRACTGRQRRS